MTTLRVQFLDRKTPKPLKGDYALEEIKGTRVIVKKNLNSEDLKFVVLQNGDGQEGALTAWLNRKRLRVAKVTREQLEKIMRLIGNPMGEPGFG